MPRFEVIESRLSGPLRAKLDVVVEMLGRLSYRDTPLPPCREIEFGLSRMVWFGPLPRPIGAVVSL